MSSFIYLFTGLWPVGTLLSAQPLTSTCRRLTGPSMTAAGFLSRGGLASYFPRRRQPWHPPFKKRVWISILMLMTRSLAWCDPFPKIQRSATSASTHKNGRAERLKRAKRRKKKRREEKKITLFASDWINSFKLKRSYKVMAWFNHHRPDWLMRRVDSLTDLGLSFSSAFAATGNSRHGLHAGILSKIAALVADYASAWLWCKRTMLSPVKTQSP